MIRWAWITVILGSLGIGGGGDSDLWQAPWRGDVDFLLKELESVPTGALLLKAAKARDPDFRTHIVSGKGSITESVFSRSYSLVDGSEALELKQQVTLNRNLSRSDALLDLAHELTHFAYRQPQNPYEAGFVEVAFVKNGIEGKGGELDAFVTECIVARELRQIRPGFPAAPSCLPYQREDESFAREDVRRDFYKVGDDWSQLAYLVPQLPELSSGQTVFTSSHAKRPYPTALVAEYRETKNAACRNNQRKATLISAQISRSPASLSNRLKAEKDRLHRYQTTFCESAEARLTRSN